MTNELNAAELRELAWNALQRQDRARLAVRDFESADAIAEIWVMVDRLQVEIDGYISRIAELESDGNGYPLKASEYSWLEW